MQATINADLVRKLTLKKKPFDVWYNTLKGFIVRVQPSGIKTYIVEYTRHKNDPETNNGSHRQAYNNA